MRETSETLIRTFVDDYMGKLFYFCLRKTGDHVEAEDLTQDIALNVVTALNQGRVPESFGAWIWQIARNRYAAWAKERHVWRQEMSGSDIGDYEIEDESTNVLDEMIRGEQLSLLRRELAFIKSEYREIVVAYYLENRSVRDIASASGLSESTVKQRLYRARIILKEGMDMAREFGKRSYNPEQVKYVMSGRDGKRGQPWSIIYHLLYQNIFLEAYDNPQTAESLALALGVALPYMQNELDFLVEQQLLCKDGNLYRTGFPIISREEQRKVFENNKSVQKPLTHGICQLIDTYMTEDGAKVDCQYVGYETAKWALLCCAFDWLQYDAAERRGRNTGAEPYPERPDDGAWTLTGYETVDWTLPAFVGMNGARSYDMAEIKQNVDFAQFKFFYKKINERTPDHLTWKEAYTLWLVCAGKLEAAEKAYLDKLLEYGYLKRHGEEIVPNVVIFDIQKKKDSDKKLAEKLAALREEICHLFDQAPKIERGYVVEQALEDGWLVYGEDTIATVGAYIYL